MDLFLPSISGGWQSVNLVVGFCEGLNLSSSFEWVVHNAVRAISRILHYWWGFKCSNAPAWSCKYDASFGSSLLCDGWRRWTGRRWSMRVVNLLEVSLIILVVHSSLRLFDRQTYNRGMVELLVQFFFRLSPLGRDNLSDLGSQVKSW